MDACSGGTIASVLDAFDTMWKGGSAIVKKMGDPLLLKPASGSPLPKASDPGGFGYDSVAKCKRNVSHLTLL